MLGRGEGCGRTAQAGSPLRFWAAATLTIVASAKRENFILREVVVIYVND